MSKSKVKPNFTQRPTVIRKGNTTTAIGAQGTTHMSIPWVVRPQIAAVLPFKQITERAKNANCNEKFQSISWTAFDETFGKDHVEFIKQFDTYEHQRKVHFNKNVRKLREADAKNEYRGQEQMSLVYVQEEDKWYLANGRQTTAFFEGKLEIDPEYKAFVFLRCFAVKDRKQMAAIFNSYDNPEQSKTTADYCRIFAAERMSGDKMPDGSKVWDASLVSDISAACAIHKYDINNYRSKCKLEERCLLLLSDAFREAALWAARLIKNHWLAYRQYLHVSSALSTMITSYLADPNAADEFWTDMCACTGGPQSPQTWLRDYLQKSKAGREVTLFVMKGVIHQYANLWWKGDRRITRAVTATPSRSVPRLWVDKERNIDSE